MKKILLFIATFMISVGMVFADSFDIELILDKKEAAPGDTVKGTIILSCATPEFFEQNVDDFYEFKLGVDYDPDLMDIKKYEIREGWKYNRDNQAILVGDFYPDPEYGKDIRDYFTEDEYTNMINTNEDCGGVSVMHNIEMEIDKDAPNGETKVFLLFASHKMDGQTIKIYKKSNDTSLKSLSVDDTNVKIVEGASSFDLVVPYDSDVVNIKYECNGPKCVVSDNGKLEKQLAVGKNTVDFTIKAEDGTEKKYTLNINRQSPNKDATIDYIYIKQSGNYGNLDLNFKEDQYTYDLKVPYDVTFIQTNATCKGEECNIYYNEVTELDEGLNTLHITVVAQSGDENEYVINIEREKKPEETPPVTPEPKKEDKGPMLILLISGICIVPLVIIILLTRKKKKIEVKDIPTNEEVDNHITPEVEEEEVTEETTEEVEEEPIKEEVEKTKEFDFKETNEYKEEE